MRCGVLVAASLLVIFAAVSGCQGAEVSRAVGARCDQKGECDERCLPPSEAFPGGFCTLSCLDDQDCTGDTRCVDVAGGICLFPCTIDGDCAFLGVPWNCEDAVTLSYERQEEVRICLGSDG